MWAAVAIAAVSAYAQNAPTVPDEKQPDDWQRWRMEQQRMAEIEARRVRRQALLGALLLITLVASLILWIGEMW